MQFNLRQNICRQARPGVKVVDVAREHIDQCLPGHVQYACRSWSTHIQKGEFSVTAVPLLKFFREHFLHWLEAMSWMENVDEVVQMLHAMALQSRTERARAVEDFVKDAVHICREFRPVISEAPLQLYYTVLTFSPLESITRQAFKGECLCPTFHPSQRAVEWDSRLQTAECHSSWVHRVAFSPNGSKLASASMDQTVRVWDAQTGRCEQKLVGHSQGVLDVAFSPNGQSLASACMDQTVRIWDLRTGACHRTLRDHFDWVHTVAFFSEGSKLVSASNDQTVRMWDAQTGALICTAEGHGSELRYDKTQTVLIDSERVIIGECRLQNSLTTTVNQEQSQEEDDKMFISHQDPDWVANEKGRYVWLPSEYRGHVWASHGDFLAIGSFSGRVTIMRSGDWGYPDECQQER